MIRQDAIRFHRPAKYPQAAAWVFTRGVVEGPPVVTVDYSVSRAECAPTLPVPELPMEWVDRILRETQAHFERQFFGGWINGHR